MSRWRPDAQGRLMSAAIALFDESVVVTLRDRATMRVHTLSMGSDDVLGLMSWLESAPPGSQYVPGSSGQSPL